MSHSTAPPLTALADLHFRGEILEDEDISAIAALRDGRLVIAADEGASIQVLHRVEDHWQVCSTLELADTVAGEADLEAIAVDDRTVWITGSHSARRKKIDPERTRKKNLKRLRTVEPEPLRDRFFSVEIDKSGELGTEVKSFSLAELLRKDPILDRFIEVPSKENGIDIEGLAHDGKYLWFGLRGPVLRGNWVPVVRVRSKSAAKPEENYTLRYVSLASAKSPLDSLVPPLLTRLKMSTTTSIVLSSPVTSSI